MSGGANISRHLPLMAGRQPDRAAIKVPRGRAGDGSIDYLALSFAELDAEVRAWAAHFARQGVRPGDRVLVMVRQGLPLIAAAFALFRHGAVPVVIDPGMGRAAFLSCVARTRPRVLLGIPLAQLLSRVFRSAFQSVELRLWASGSPTARRWSGPAADAPVVAPAASAPGDLAAILFTSGSTGAPKGVRYEHGMFDAQVRLVRDAYGIEPGEVDLPLLPIFALFNPALGLTTIVPEIDPSRPAALDPARIVQAIRQERVTNSFGSPTLWRRLVDHCLASGLTLPGVRRVLCAGAPVPASLWADAPRVLTGGRLHSPYGATEVLPVSTIAHDEVDDDGPGAPVGRPLPGNRVRIIAVRDEPIARLGETRELPAGEIGEIIVSGPTVTREYDQLPDATARAKISEALPDGSTAVWHRMGDAGCVDGRGLLRFCGRVAERVETATGTLHTEPCEQVFRRHPRVERCALVGIGPRGCQEPVLVVQPAGKPTRADGERLARELGELAAQHPHTAGITRFLFHPAFPVDVRHNAKIHRLALARWAGRRLARG